MNCWALSTHDLSVFAFQHSIDPDLTAFPMPWAVIKKEAGASVSARGFQFDSLFIDLRNSKVWKWCSSRHCAIESFTYHRLGRSGIGVGLLRCMFTLWFLYLFLFMWSDRFTPGVITKDASPIVGHFGAKYVISSRHHLSKSPSRPPWVTSRGSGCGLASSAFWLDRFGQQSDAFPDLYCLCVSLMGSVTELYFVVH